MFSKEILTFLVVWTSVTLAVDGFFLNPYPRLAPRPPAADCGEPLYLTPLIRAGRSAEARSRSSVVVPGFPDVVGHSGYLTVNPTRGSHTFFWYFAAEQAPAEAPVLLWLQGGPGASSLYGLFSENGPFRFEAGRLERREYSWSRDHHVIYIDNPVGTGFSSTVDGYARNETAVGGDLYEALLQFFQLFPDLQKSEFFVTGESYAGKYVPAVCYAIHRGNPGAALKINLKGFAIGNGLSDPVHQLSYGPYLYQLGLVDRNGLKQIEAFERRGIDYIKAGRWLDAFDIFDTLLNGDVTPYPSLFYNLTGYKYYFNYLSTEDNTHSDDFVKLLESSEFRKAIHVGNLTFHDGSQVETHMREDMMQSVAGWVAELLSHYRGVIYNGQLDIIVAYPLTENYLRALPFSAAEEYARAPRGIWRVGELLAGYAKRAGNLTEVLVRGAGHMVPADQPRAAADLVHRLTANKPFF